MTANIVLAVGSGVVLKTSTHVVLKYVATGSIKLVVTEHVKKKTCANVARLVATDIDTPCCVHEVDLKKGEPVNVTYLAG